MEPLLEWVVRRQQNKVEAHDVASADAGMHSSAALSRNLWGYLNLALAGTGQAKEFHKVTRLNGLEAWRRIVVPLKPRSEAKRNALHSHVHNPPRSKSLNLMIDDLDEWKKVVEQYELCGGVLTEADRRTILLRKLPASISSSLVSNLRKIPRYADMRTDIEGEITFTKEFGLGSAGGQAHVAAAAEEQPEDDEDYGDDDQCPEGFLDVDLSGMTPEQSEPILIAARQAGLRVRQLFKRAWRRRWRRQSVPA